MGAYRDIGLSTGHIRTTTNTKIRFLLNRIQYSILQRKSINCPRELLETKYMRKKDRFTFLPLLLLEIMNEHVATPP